MTMRTIIRMGMGTAILTPTAMTTITVMITGIHIPTLIPILTDPAMATTLTAEAVAYRLMTWLSSSYPLGSFSYSHGLEYAVEEGLVWDRDSLVRWVSFVIETGAGRVDAALFAASWRAVKRDDFPKFLEIAELADAWRGTAETALEAQAQGTAFLMATRAAWPHEIFDRLPQRIALPVVVGAACAAHGLPLEASLTAYLHAFAGTIVSAGVKLIPLGQTDGQRTIAALESVILETGTSALTEELDEVGSSAVMVDWCSMRHETQYTRLFRS